ncbi:putative xanthine/uracil permease [Cladophialophora carrionii]|uniref:Putative xanthine/uracil permease n=1 Tax=Cladophialophora carrionii TaxID=86049 RepID=A0A1C1CZE8_9EURO|nr:putative xanthine/uracil permease [Cladophialophora carrionii]
MSATRPYTKAINDYVAKSTFGRVFRLQGCGHEKEIQGTTFLTELRAGVTTFATMAYIIAVNASIVSQSGGTCVCQSTSDPTCLKDTEYAGCVLDVQRDLITTTAAISGLASFMFGFLTNLPVALAPGMGLNAYFTYQVVGFHGTGPVSYRLALTAVFIEGFIFVFLSLIGMRQWLVAVIPSSLKIASTAGIGLFLTLIGLSTSAGLGVITGAQSTPLDLAGCLAKYQDEFGVCQSHKLQNPTVWIGIFCGGIITALLIMYKVKSAMIVGIAVVSIMSWPRSTSFTYFPDTPEGNDRFDFFKKVVHFHPIQHTLAAQDWDVAGAGPKFALALFTFLYVDILDCTGTLYSMARFSGVVDEKTGAFPRSTLAYCTDAVSISIGSLMGTSPVTAFIESGAGIAEGGRTGLTAMTTGVCFFIAIFFSPIFASIPPWATGCTLVLVGWMMARSIVDINWKYAGDALPAFVTLIFMPFSYSIAYGLIA